MIETMRWEGDRLLLLDQRLLPKTIEFVECLTAEAVSEAITAMVVRGAPAIGVAAAYGVVLAVKACQNVGAIQDNEFQDRITRLRNSRPTAVNLMWAVDRMIAVIGRTQKIQLEDLVEICDAEARLIEQEDVNVNRAIGGFGASVCTHHQRILTYCNAGALATAGYGTALGVVRSASERYDDVSVFACETRPYLQGSRLTSWELMQDSIPVTLIADNMVGYAMSKSLIDIVVVGTDRVTSNGDVANKIGTYQVAIIAKRHGVPFYVATPTSTIDFNLSSGTDIPIEQRPSHEVTGYGSEQFAPNGINVLNPAFDVTPAELVTGLITEYGIVNPCSEALQELKRKISRQVM